MTNVSRNQNWAVYLIFNAILWEKASFKTVLTILAQCCGSDTYVSPYCRGSGLGGTQPTSKAACEALGATLVSPTTADEQTALQNAIASSVCIDLLYIK